MRSCARDTMSLMYPLAALVLPILCFSLPRISTASDNAESQARENSAKLIRLLSDDDFNVREQAAADLVKLGQAARRQLEQAAKEAKDIEVRARAEDVLKGIEREQLKAFEMHVVGIHRASKHGFWLIHPYGSVTDWRRLCAALVAQGKADAKTPGKRFWELLLPRRAKHYER